MILIDIANNETFNIAWTLHSEVDFDDYNDKMKQKLPAGGNVKLSQGW